MTRKVLTFSAAIEAATGLAALGVPLFVGQLLLGVEVSGVASVVVRCFGIALIALSVACWPGAEATVLRRGAVRGMLLYNGLIALCLAYAGGVDGLRGPLLWPAVILHAVVALLLVRPRSTSPSTP
jgi:hypothetical protein